MHHHHNSDQPHLNNPSPSGQHRLILLVSVMLAIGFYALPTRAQGLAAIARVGQEAINFFSVGHEQFDREIRTLERGGHAQHPILKIKERRASLPDQPAAIDGISPERRSPSSPRSD